MADEIKTTSTGMNQNVAGLLCYLAGWVTGLIFFPSFHAAGAVAR